MFPGQRSDREKIRAPEQQCETSAVAFAFRHAGEHPRHRHDKAADEKDAVNDHQPLQPPLRTVFRPDGQAGEERGKRHHTVPEQVVVEEQSALPVIQDIRGLPVQFLQPHGGCLGIIDQENQHGIDRCERHPDVRAYPRVLSALMLETGSHHDKADRQEHTHQVGTEQKSGDDADCKKEYVMTGPTYPIPLFFISLLILTDTSDTVGI